jgi:hypothetical protein
MPISILCRHCDKTYRIKDELAGKRAKCPQGHLLVVPELDAETSPFVFSDREARPAKAEPMSYQQFCIRHPVAAGLLGIASLALIIGFFVWAFVTLDAHSREYSLRLIATEIEGQHDESRQRLLINGFNRVTLLAVIGVEVSESTTGERAPGSRFGHLTKWRTFEGEYRLVLKPPQGVQIDRTEWLLRGRSEVPAQITVPPDTPEGEYIIKANASSPKGGHLAQSKISVVVKRSP